MKTKIVYQLDENCVLTGTTEAQESPLEPGVYMIPAGCIDTDIKPPTIVGGECLVWRDGNWWTGTRTDPNSPSSEAVARDWRDSELLQADITLLKIQDGMTGLGNVGDWRKYRIALRTWPEAEGFPSIESRPLRPNFKI